MGFILVIRIIGPRGYNLQVCLTFPVVVPVTTAVLVFFVFGILVLKW